MKKQIFQLGLSLALMLGSFAAHAATYYVSDCQAGAVAGCVAGSDSNAGTSAAAPWKTTAKVLSRFSGMKAGDKILFARGGAWINSQMYGLRNTNATMASPITFDAYSPAWYTGRKKPLLMDSRADITIFAFTGNSVVQNKGYVIRNLELRGRVAPTGSSGIFINRGAGGLIVDNITTRDLNIGFYCGDDSYDNVIRNSTITHSRFSGLFGGCNNWLIENNTLDHNGYTSQPGAIPNRNHAIYIGKAPTVQTGVVIRGNKVTNSVQFDGVCQGVPIVGHGQMNNLVIEDNVIDETPNVGPNKGGCWGIAISPAWGGDVEKLENVYIRRNRVINVGGIGIEVGGCDNCFIENNVIVKNDGHTGAGTSFIGIQAPGVPPNPEDAPMGNLTIRNNSIYFSNPNQQWGSSGIQVWKGSGHVMVGNLIHFQVASNNGNTCFTGDGAFPALALSKFVAYDNNLCYRAGNHGRYSLAYATLGQASNAGFDVNGSSANPQFAATTLVAANKWSLALLSGSPAIGASHATRSAPADIDKATRTDHDIGAFEFPGAAATVPGAPRSVAAELVTGMAQAYVTFSPPLKDGRRPITGYTVTSSPAGATDSNAGKLSLKHLMTGLTPGVSYTFTVKATNSIGTGPASTPSSAVRAP